MKIIKHGNPRQSIMRFECTHCGCVFELDRNLGEQQIFINGQLDIIGRHCPPYYTRCPDCRRFADGDYVKG